MLSLELFTLALLPLATAIPARTRITQGVRIPRVPRQVASNDTDDFVVLHHLAGIAPYFESPGVGLMASPPDGCNVSSAAYLLRHGEIYANEFDYEEYIEPFIWKVGNMSDKSVFNAFKPLAFLSTWTNPISDDTVSELTPSGAEEATALGKLVQKRYPSLLKNSSDLRVWTSTADRSKDSAKAFIKGLTNADRVTLEEVYESSNSSANTLTPHKSCPAFSASAGSEESGEFRDLYTKGPINRLSAGVQGLNLTAKDIYAMQALCGYETVIRNSSQFCADGLFTDNEWLGFEYTNDIMYSYSLGYGGKASPQMGMPWLRASTDLIASDATSDAQRVFISFSHREEPPFVLTALGLYNDTMISGGNISSYYPTDRINYERDWKFSFIGPFLGHVALERLSCPSIKVADSTEYVRVLVNSAPIPLPQASLQTGPDGSAPLGAFVDFVKQRAALFGDFSKACGVTDGNATDTLGVFGSAFKEGQSPVVTSSAGSAAPSQSPQEGNTGSTGWMVGVPTAGLLVALSLTAMIV